MLSASQCRARARECRILARSMGEDYRPLLLDMARAWDGLARDKQRACNRRITLILKAAFDRIAQEPVPEAFRSLLAELAAAEARTDTAGHQDVPARTTPAGD